MLVTLSGLPGSGTSTVARPVAAALGIAHLDGGTVFRAIAAERGLSLSAFARLAEADDAIDRALDERLAERMAAGDVLVESRLAAWLARQGGHRGLKVWIACEEHERARRVGARDGHELTEAVATNRVREASERLRYQQYYGIDLTDLTVYDLVIDSTELTPDEIVAAIVTGAQAHLGSQAPADH